MVIGGACNFLRNPSLGQTLSLVNDGTSLPLIACCQSNVAGGNDFLVAKPPCL